MYVYEEVVLKGTEGGEVGGVSRWRRLNKYYKNRNIKFYTHESVFVGNYVKGVKTKTKAEMRKVLQWLKDEFGDVENVKEAMTHVRGDSVEI